MEFGIRELIQFGTLLASLAGAFAVVKSQLARVIQDIKNRIDKNGKSWALVTIETLEKIYQYERSAYFNEYNQIGET